MTQYEPIGSICWYGVGLQVMRTIKRENRSPYHTRQYSRRMKDLEQWERYGIATYMTDMTIKKWKAYKLRQEIQKRIQATQDWEF